MEPVRIMFCSWAEETIVWSSDVVSEYATCNLCFSPRQLHLCEHLLTCFHLYRLPLPKSPPDTGAWSCLLSLRNCILWFGAKQLYYCLLFQSPPRTLLPAAPLLRPLAPPPRTPTVSVGTQNHGLDVLDFPGAPIFFRYEKEMLWDSNKPLHSAKLKKWCKF